jgi:hypothetical protein
MGLRLRRHLGRTIQDLPKVQDPKARIREGGRKPPEPDTPKILRFDNKAFIHYALLCKQPTTKGKKMTIEILEEEIGQGQDDLEVLSDEILEVEQELNAVNDKRLELQDLLLVLRADRRERLDRQRVLEDRLSELEG